jgi:Nucleotidyltransferase of unknown function (DUF6036)
LALPRFEKPELTRFLVEVDRALSAPGSVVIIGGAAAILQYGATRPTVDIDTYSVAPTGLEDAIRKAWTATGLEISVEYAAVADAPYNYEDRLERLRSPRLERLQVLVPERHDLALMKITRAEERDLVVLDQMHAKRPFDSETLVSRYLDEMSHAAQDPRILRQKFLLSTARLFGRDVAEEAHDRLMRVPAERALAATSRVVNGRALHRSGIRPETIALERFDGAIRQDATGAIVFPLRDSRGVVGLALETLTGSEVRGEAALGVWASQSKRTDKTLVIISDPVDALAAHQGTPDPNTRYIATAGAIGREKGRLLRDVFRQIPAGRRVLLGFGGGPDGDRLATTVQELVPSTIMIRHIPPRLRSWRSYVQDIERNWIRSQGLEVRAPGRDR